MDPRNTKASAIGPTAVQVAREIDDAEREIKRELSLSIESSDNTRAMRIMRLWLERPAVEVLAELHQGRAA